MGLQRIMHRSQPRDERPKPIQVGLGDFRIVLQVGVGIRMELGQIGVDEMGLVQQAGFELQTLVQLVLQQQSVNRKAPEAPAVLMLNVVNDQLDQLGIVGPLHSREQVTPPLGCQFGGHEPIERRVFEALQIAVTAVGQFGQRVPSDELLVQRGRQIGFAAENLSPVVELDVELPSDILERLLRLILVFQEGLAVEDLACPSRVVVGLDPCGEQFVDLVIFPQVLLVQGMVVEIVLGARD